MGARIGVGVVALFVGGCFTDSNVDEQDESLSASSSDDDANTAGSSGAPTISSTSPATSMSTTGPTTTDPTATSSDPTGFETEDPPPTDSCALVFAAEATKGEGLSEFPVLVNLDPAEVDLAGCDPATLAFRGGAPEAYAHEIERWDDGGQLWVWVRVPRVTFNDNRIFLDCSGEGPGSDAIAVWGDLYRAVWHFNDDPLEEPSLVDSLDTMHGLPRSLATPPTQAQGAIGHALEFVDSGTPAFDVTGNAVGGDWSALTVEAWVFPTELGSMNRHIAVKFDFFDFAVANANGPERFTIYDSPGAGGSAAEGNGLNPNEWAYLVGTWDGRSGAVSLSRNGQQPIEGASTSGPHFADNSPLDLVRRYAGRIDELRFSDRVHSDRWIRAQYLSMTGQLLTPENCEP